MDNMNINIREIFKIIRDEETERLSELGITEEIRKLIESSGAYKIIVGENERDRNIYNEL